jgi:hypothetical protein
MQSANHSRLILQAGSMGRSVSKMVLRPAGNGQVAMGDTNGTGHPDALDHADIHGHGSYTDAGIATADQ